MRKLFRQFSFPGGIPSHAAPETPGSIHEGGELGYALSHAFGAAFDNPELLVACVVGDGEAETGPLAASWHSNKFLNAKLDGAVLPILHLNGYKIANPTVLARIPEEELLDLFQGYGWEPILVSGGLDGEESPAVHERFALALDNALDAIDGIQQAARAGGPAPGRWPMLILRTPKGWTGPREVDGKPVEGTWRAHQVPLAAVREDPDHLEQLERWMQSYRPAELFDESGRLMPELAALAPSGDARMSANPHANGGVLMRELVVPEFRRYGVDVPTPGTTRAEAMRVLGGFLRDVVVRNPDNFRVFGPDETASNRLGAVLEVTGRAWSAATLPTDEGLAPDGRVMEVLSEHLLPGLARGLSPHRPPRRLQLLRGVHSHRRLDVQPAREVVEGLARRSLASPDPLVELPPQLTRLATGSQRLLASGSRVHRPRRQQEGRGDPRLPASGCEHAALCRRPLPAKQELRQRCRGRKATRSQLPLDGRSGRPLHSRSRPVGVGLERRSV